MFRPYLALAPLALLAACGSSVDPEDVLETVRMTEQAQMEALAAKDLDGVVRNYAADAVLIVPGRAPVDGGEAVRAAYQDLLGDPNARLEIEPRTAWAASSGDLAVTTAAGRITTTDPASGMPVTVPLSNQTVWRRSPGDPWRISSEYNVATVTTEVAAAQPQPKP